MTRNKKTALALAMILAFGLICSRPRIYVWLNASLWPVILLLIGLALACYLGISVLAERRPPDDSHIGADDR